jgi:hypothetical protein
MFSVDQQRTLKHALSFHLRCDGCSIIRLLGSTSHYHNNINTITLTLEGRQNQEETKVDGRINIMLDLKEQVVGSTCGTIMSFRTMTK